MTARLLLGALLAASARSQTKTMWSDRTVGVLLLSHGGSEEWDQAIRDVEHVVSSSYPVVVAFGMADPREIQRAAEDLVEFKVKKIVAVPLFVSSHSEVIDETQYVLGMRKDPSHTFTSAAHAHMMEAVVARAQFKASVVMTPALDEHPIVADILVDRAKKMSRDPSKEYVILVGHGPLKDSDNGLWLDNMNKLAREVRRRGGFAGAYSATLRDDSPQNVRAKADKILRDMVADLSRKGRVLVVPLLVAPGGIERHIRQALDGLFYDWTGRTLLPDRRIARWVLESVEKYKDRPDMRRFKDAGHAPPPPPAKKLIEVDATRGSRGP